MHDMNSATGPALKPGEMLLEGRWAVVAALACPAVRVKRVLCAADANCDWLHDVNVPDARKPVVDRIPRAALNAIAGYDFHRGVLAVADEPVDEPLKRDALPERVIFLPELADAANVGAIVRNAAALGAVSVWTGARGASPWTRKAIRASAGACFRIRVRRSPDLLADARTWLAAGRPIVAASLAPESSDIDALSVGNRWALAIGSEVRGLSPAWMKLCTHPVRIRMDSSIDSLNAAAASAVFLHTLRHQGRPST